MFTLKAAAALVPRSFDAVPSSPEELAADAWLGDCVSRGQLAWSGLHDALIDSGMSGQAAFEWSEHYFWDH